MSNKGFSFESNLEHQQKAVDSVIDVQMETGTGKTYRQRSESNIQIYVG